MFIGILIIFSQCIVHDLHPTYIINYSDILYFSHFGTDDKYFQLFLVVCSAKFIAWERTGEHHPHTTVTPEHTPHKQARLSVRVSSRIVLGADPNYPATD